MRGVIRQARPMAGAGFGGCRHSVARSDPDELGFSADIQEVHIPGIQRCATVVVWIVKLVRPGIPHSAWVLR